jgi:hypothetical protein
VCGLGDPTYLPLLAELARPGDVDLHFLPGAFVAEARAAGLPAYDLLAGLDAATMRRIAAGHDRFVEGIAGIGAVLAGSFRAGGRALWPRTRKSVVRIVADAAKQARIVECVLEALARETRLAAAVLGVDTVPAGRAVAAVARRLGVPTVLVPHGVFGRPRVAMRWHGTEPFTDLVCAPGQFSRDGYIAGGARPEAVPLTGSPRWDIYAAIDPPARSACRAAVSHALGLDPTAPILVYGASWNERETAHSRAHLLGLLAVYRGVLAAVRANPGVQLVVKLHPGEMTRPGLDQSALLEGYAGVARRAGVERIAVTGGYKTELLAAADLVVSINSNLGLEALLCGRPLVNVPFMAGDADILFTPAPGLVALRGPADTAEAVGALLADAARREQLAAGALEGVRRWVHEPDGRAGERVAAVVSRLAEAA